MTIRTACGYYQGIKRLFRPNSRVIVRALILTSSLALVLSTLSTSAGQEHCRDALAARGELSDNGGLAEAVDAFYAKSGKACVWT